MKIIITEEEKNRIKGLYENLSPDHLTSIKGRWTKDTASALNKYYNVNLPLTGDWMDKGYNETLKKFMEENNIPVWVCKTGDGWCPDNSDGEVTTKSNDLWKKFVKPFINKDMSGGTVDNQETSTNNFTKDMADMLNIDEYYLKFMELPIPVHAQNNPQNYLKERYTELTQKMRENIKQEPDAAKTFFEKLTNITKYQNSLNSQQKFFLNSLTSYYPKLITPTTVNITQNPKDLEKVKSKMNSLFGNLSQDKLNLIKQGINKVNQQDDVY